jgi:hypothetical protein
VLRYAVGRRLFCFQSTRFRAEPIHLQIKLDSSACWASEHTVSVSALSSCNLFLQYVPMLRDFAIGYTEDIDPDHRLRSPSDIAAMNHDIVAVGRHNAGLIFEIR